MNSEKAISCSKVRGKRREARGRGELVYSLWPIADSDGKELLTVDHRLSTIGHRPIS